MERVLDGGCQCGAVRYHYEGAIRFIFCCHCTECQKQSGSAFGMGLWLDASGLTRVSGTLRTWTRRLAAGEDLCCEFCEACGTRVYHTSDGYRAAGLVSIKPGTLDDSSWVRPLAHTWRARAQPWVVFAPDGLVYDGNPPQGFSRLAEECARAR